MRAVVLVRPPVAQPRALERMAELRRGGAGHEQTSRQQRRETKTPHAHHCPLTFHGPDSREKGRGYCTAGPAERLIPARARLDQRWHGRGDVLHAAEGRSNCPEPPNQGTLVTVECHHVMA